MATERMRQMLCRTRTETLQTTLSIRVTIGTLTSLFAHRRRNRSVRHTSQLPVDSWHAFIAEARYASGPETDC